MFFPDTKENVGGLTPKTAKSTKSTTPLSSNGATTPPSRFSTKRIVRVRKTPSSSASKSKHVGTITPSTTTERSKIPPRSPSSSATKTKNAAISTPRTTTNAKVSANNTPEASRLDFTVVFEPGPVGLQLEPVTENNKYGCRVVRFVDGGPKNPGQARRSGKINPGDLVVQVDDSKVVSKTYDEIIAVLKNANCKRAITFRSVWDPSLLSTPSNVQSKLPTSTNSKSSTPNRHRSRSLGLGSSKKVLRVHTPTVLEEPSPSASLTPFSQVESTFLRDPETPALPTFLNGDRNPSPIRHNASHFHNTTIDISMVNSPTQAVLLAGVFGDHEQTTTKNSNLSTKLSGSASETNKARTNDAMGIIEPLNPVKDDHPPSSQSHKLFPPQGRRSRFNKSRLPMSSPLLASPSTTTPLPKQTDVKTSIDSPIDADTSFLAAATAYVVREFCGEANPTPSSEKADSVVSEFQTPQTPFTDRLTSPPLSLETLATQLDGSPFSPSSVKKLTSATKNGRRRPQTLLRVLNTVYENVAPAVVSSSYAVGSTVAKNIVPNMAYSSYSLGSAVTTRIGEAIVGNSTDEFQKANELKFQLLQELSHAKAALDVHDNERSDLEHSIAELFRENMNLREALEKNKGEIQTNHDGTVQTLSKQVGDHHRLEKIEAEKKQVEETLRSVTAELEMSCAMVEGMESRVLEVEAAKADIENAFVSSQTAASEVTESLRRTIDQKEEEIESLRRNLEIESKCNLQKDSELLELASKYDLLTSRNNELEVLDGTAQNELLELRHRFESLENELCLQRNKQLDEQAQHREVNLQKEKEFQEYKHECDSKVQSFMQNLQMKENSVLESQELIQKLDAQNKSLLDQVDDLTKEISSLRTERSVLLEDMDRMKVDLLDAKNDAAETHDRLLRQLESGESKAQSEVEQKDRELFDMEQLLKKSNDQVLATDMKLQTLRKEKNVIEETVVLLKNDIDAVKLQSVELEDELEKCKEHNKVLTGHKTSVDSEIEEARSEVLHLRDKLSSLEECNIKLEEYSKELEVKLKKSTKSAAKADSMGLNYVKSLKRSSCFEIRLLHSESEIVGLTQELSELGTKMAVLKDSKDSLEQRVETILIEKMNGEAQASKRIASIIADLQSKSADLETAIEAKRVSEKASSDKISRLIDEGVKQDERFQTVSSRVTDMATAIESLQNENLRLKKQIEEISLSKCEQEESFSSRVNDLDFQLQQATKELDLKAGALSILESERENHAIEFCVLQKRLEDTGIKLSSEMVKASILEETNKSLRDKISELSDSELGVRENFEIIVSQLDECRKEVSRTISTYEQKNEELDLEINQLAAERSQQEKKLSLTAKKVASLEALVGTLNAEKASLEKSQDSNSHLIAESKAQILQLESEKIDRLKEIASLELKLKESENGVLSILQDKKKLTAENKNMNDRLSSSFQTISKLESSICSLASSKASLELELETMERRSRENSLQSAKTIRFLEAQLLSIFQRIKGAREVIALISGENLSLKETLEATKSKLMLLSADHQLEQDQHKDTKTQLSGALASITAMKDDMKENEKAATKIESRLTFTREVVECRLERCEGELSKAREEIRNLLLGNESLARNVGHLKEKEQKICFGLCLAQLVIPRLEQQIDTLTNAQEMVSATSGQLAERLASAESELALRSTELLAANASATVQAAEREALLLENGNMKARLKDIEHEKSSLNSDVNKLQSRLTDSEAKLVSAISVTSKLQSDLAKQERAAAEALSACRQDNLALVSANQSLEIERNDLNSCKTKIKLGLELASVRIHRLEQTVTALDSKFALKSLAFFNAAATIESLETEKKLLRADKDILEARILKSESELAATILSLEKSLASYSSEVGARDELKSELNRTLGDLSESRGHVSSLESEIQELQERHKSELWLIQQNITELQNALSDAREDYTKTSSKLGVIEAEKADLEAENCELRMSVKEKDEMLHTNTNDLAEYTSKLDTMHSELQEKTLALTESRLELENTKKDVDRLLSSLNDKTTEARALSIESSSWEQKCSHLNDEIQQLHKRHSVEIKDVQELLEKEKSQAAQLLTSVEKERQEYCELSVKLENSKKEILALIKSKEETSKNHDEQLTHLKAVHDAALHDVSSEKKQLEHELGKALHGQETITAILRDKDKQLAVDQGQIEILRKEKERLSSSLHDAEDVIAELRCELLIIHEEGNESSDSDTVNSELNHLSTSELKVECMCLHEELVETEKRATDLKADKLRLERRMKSLESDLDAVSKEMHMLLRTNQNLDERIQDLMSEKDSNDALAKVIAEAHASELDNLTQKLKKRSVEISLLSRYIQLLSDNSDSKSLKLQRQKDELEIDLQLLRKSFVMLRAECAASRTQIQLQTKDITSLDEMRKASETEILSLRTRLETLQRESNTSMKQLEARHLEAKTELERLTKERTSNETIHKVKFEEMGRKIDSLRSNLSSKEARIDDLNTSLNKECKHGKKIDSLRKIAVDKLSEASDIIASQKKEISSLAIRLDQEEKAASSLSKEVARLLDSKEQAEEQHRKELQSAMNQRQQALEERDAARAGTEEKLEELRQTSRKCLSLQRLNESLSDRLDELKNSLNDTKVELAQACAACEVSSTSSKNIEKDLADKLVQIKQDNAKIQMLEATISRMHSNDVLNRPADKQDQNFETTATEVSLLKKELRIITCHLSSVSSALQCEKRVASEMRVAEDTLFKFIEEVINFTTEAQSEIMARTLLLRRLEASRVPNRSLVSLDLAGSVDQGVSVRDVHSCLDKLESLVSRAQKELHRKSAGLNKWKKRHSQSTPMPVTPTFSAGNLAFTPNREDHVNAFERIQSLLQTEIVASAELDPVRVRKMAYSIQEHIKSLSEDIDSTYVALQDKEKLFSDMEKLVAQQDSERLTLEKRISFLDKENQEFEERLEEEISSRNASEKELSCLRRQASEVGLVSKVPVHGLDFELKSTAKIAAARLLCSALNRRAKNETAAAFRKWSCSVSAVAAVSNQKDTAVALAQQLQVTREKLHALKAHLKNSRRGQNEKKRKPRLRRLLDRLEKRDQREPGVGEEIVGIE